MIFRIPKHWHYALPIRPWLWWRRRVFTWQVTFTDSCRYDLQGPDQLDTNKLVGVGYLPHHHVDSARFGWAYNLDSGKIDLSAYCYHRGTRLIKPICSCEIGRPYKLTLYCMLGVYTFDCADMTMLSITESVDIHHGHDKALQYRLGPYFGGNQKAPHDIRIEIK